ncbi:uncharacterized protein ACBR49_020130 [Aulostomus maculatus]
MKLRAGFLTLLCAWVMILFPSAGAGHGPKKHAGSSCMLKELSALTKVLLVMSLTIFDEANGKHLGTWSPGFPQLQVHKDSPFHGPEVQCSLIFMASGLENVLDDQKNNLNPIDTLLLRQLKETISRVSMLVTCVRDIFGGECSPKPTPPKMPKHTFERKQWGHTFLKASRDYMEWLEDNRNSKLKHIIKINHGVTKGKFKKYLEWSGYLNNPS